MNSLSAWAALVLVAVGLTLVAYHFSLSALRVTAAVAALATAAYLTWYGLGHFASPAGSLSDAFTRGADALIVSLVPAGRVAPGHDVPGPGQIGWLVIIVLLVIGYRELEAWSLHWQARSLDTSALSQDRQDDAPGGRRGAMTDKERHDRLVAELKFRLPAVEVRSPSIFPGGSRSGGLASIAEASGIDGSGLAAAVIRFFGMLWPRPRQLQVRVWVEPAPGQVQADGITRVTVDLEDPRTGASIASKTLAASNLDDAASVVAGYVARNIFVNDPTAPPWCTGAADGRDLAAMLLARQVRIYPESEDTVKNARSTQIQILKNAAGSSLCAGVVRYELAQLHDLEGEHVPALLLHATNRERYPRFYRGRFRLAMSMKMVASRGEEIGVAEAAELREALKILCRCGVTKACGHQVWPGHGEMPAWLRAELLDAARQELRAIRRHLLFWPVVWQSFWHRDERGILKPYLRLPYRQAFHDGICVALLDVAVRQALLAGQDGDRTARPPAAAGLPHSRALMRIAAAIAGDSSAVADHLGLRPVKPGRGHAPMVRRLGTRLWPWACRTRSWQAAYNLACAYAAIAEDRMRELEECRKMPADAPARTRASHLEDKLRRLAGQVVTSLEFAVSNPECEMERPWEWIANDPDFSVLRSSRDKCVMEFLAFLCTQKERDYPSRPVDEPPGSPLVYLAPARAAVGHEERIVATEFARWLRARSCG
jgi:hypothetical protein